MRGRELDAAGVTDPWLRAAYETCRRLNASHGKTYYLATLLLPAAKRPHVHALYGFARYADEFVDSLQAPDPEALLGWGKAFLDGAFGWYGLILVMFIFNTVLGEELLFRGYLLPRMNGVFGRGDWVANGLLFAGYHLHVPWAIPGTLLEMFTTAYPTKRYRSAWIGIAVHSAQSVFLAILILTLVL